MSGFALGVSLACPCREEVSRLKGSCADFLHTPACLPPLACAPGDLPVVPALGSDVFLHASEDDPTVVQHVLLSLLL